MNKTIRQELNRLLPNKEIQSIHGEHFMRFELGGGNNRNSFDRIEQATKRALEIYENIIGYNDIIIVIEEWESDWLDPNNHNKDNIAQILEGFILKRISGPFDQTYYDEDSEGNRIERIFEDKLECDLLIGKITLKSEQVKSIIKGIASFELREEISIPQNVYFYSIEKQAGFRIYDDRGCDIWAESIETLRPIYKNFNSWILDYNRKKIDSMFEIK